MNKYFSVWLLSCMFYALGFTNVVLFEGTATLSAAYICNEIFQICGVLCIYYACNLIDNFPHSLNGFRYGTILLIFVVAYGYVSDVDQTVYIAMLLFKLAAVLMTIYTIIVKWRFPVIIKVASITILGSSGIYLSLYDFLIYDGTESSALLFVCIGIFYLVGQNFILALLFRLQVLNQEKLKGDYLTIFAENSADIIFFYTMQPYPRFSFVSPASKVVLGYSPEDFYNNSKLHLEITLERERTNMKELFSNFQSDTHRDIIKVERRDGETVHLECFATKVKINGKFVAVEGIMRDISERAEAEKKVRESNKNRQLMLSYISHDLKTPITYITAYTEAIMKNVLKTEKEKADAIDAIHHRADALGKLVEDISLLSKLEASKFNYAFEEIKCLELVQYIREHHLLHDIEDRKHVVSVDETICEADCVLVDIKRIDQVLDNLLSNAQKATQRGDAIHTLIELDRKRKSFLISIIDRGLGISQEDLPHIFENFYRSPETKKRTDGSGLGLSLSKQIIQGHGGDLQAVSAAGQGTKMTIVLPLFMISFQATGAGAAAES